MFPFHLSDFVIFAVTAVLATQLILANKHTHGAAAAPSTDSSRLLKPIRDFIHTSSALENALSPHELSLLRSREPDLNWHFFSNTSKEDPIAFTENKRDIHICRDGDMNTQTYIILHELAHIATDLQEENHGDAFYARFRKIASAAHEDGLYHYENYQKSPTRYCGKLLRHQVLDM